ncbi:MAG: PAS domain S-box protein [Candidatus Cloacimonetes bacterium]|nr:PAS domain S-box protein [Candidatus Cloacimonadota bacterium]
MIESHQLNSKDVYQLISKSNFIVWKIDRQGIIQLALGHGHTLIGFKEGELTNKNIFEILAESKSFIKHLKFALSGEQFKAPIEIIGSIFEVSFIPYQEKSNGSYCILTDITDYKRIELELRENEGRYRRLSEASYEGVGIIQNGIIIDANRSLADMFGYRTYEVLGLPAMTIIDEPSKSIVLENLASNYERAYQIKAIRKDSSVYDAEISHKQIPSQGKNLKVIAIRDLTERVLAEQAIKQKNIELHEVNQSIQIKNLELEQANKSLKESHEKNQTMENKLIQAKKMISLSTLAAGIGHEISQPLNALKITIDAIEFWYQQGKVFEEKSLREKLKKASNHANRITEIINQLRALYGQSPSREVRSICINEAITRVSQMQSETLQKHNILTQLTLDDSIPKVMVNPIQFEQVIINLINNAIHALNTVKFSSKSIEIKTEFSNNTILMTFEDNGPGFSSDLQEVFDPFFTNKQGEGMGLGLSLIHTFVSSWNGDVYATNKQNGGAKIVISLNPERMV